MSISKTDRVVLITGANRGIGLETARQLAGRGWHVVIAARDEAKASKAAKSIESTGGKASALALDVSNSDSIRSASKDFAEIADRLDVLINNAGIYPDEGLSILKLSREQLDATLQTNTLGPLQVTQAFLPYLQKSSPTRVIMPTPPSGSPTKHHKSSPANSFATAQKFPGNQAPYVQIFESRAIKNAPDAFLFAVASGALPFHQINRD
jgi:NAD(P)-dependent dehydrogenase (short-subunit alcohol dehydrogenase family)